MRRRTWWHCTQDNHGPELIVSKRPPVTRGAKEPETPRLCVSETIAGCFVGALFYKRQPVYCYRTEKPMRANKPVGVWDAVVSGERWIVPPARLVLDRVLFPHVAVKATEAMWLYHAETGLASNVTLKCCLRKMAFDAVGGPAWEGRLISRWMKIVGVTDAESCILEATANRARGMA